MLEPRASPQAFNLCEHPRTLEGVSNEERIGAFTSELYQGDTDEVTKLGIYVDNTRDTESPVLCIQDVSSFGFPTPAEFRVVLGRNVANISQVDLAAHDISDRQERHAFELVRGCDMRPIDYKRRDLSNAGYRP